MATAPQTSQPKGMPTWKRPLLISAGIGAGVVFALSAIFGTFVWYQSRPKPSKPWNTSAIIAREPPTFSRKDDSHLTFRYVLENLTDSDYEVKSSGKIKTMIKGDDGTLMGPTEMASLVLPIFIPAKQRAGVFVFVAVGGPLPKQSSQETNKQYHERLRSYLEEHVSRFAGVSLFDDTTRYRIDLPRWLSERSK